jgi:hypothetical protein
MGYYKEGGKRWRMVAFDVATMRKGLSPVDAAKAEFKVIRGRIGALPVADVGDEGAEVVTSGDAKTSYVFARKAGNIFGVGDDEFAKDAQARLSKDEKIAKLKAALSASIPAPAPSSSPSSPKK